MEESLTKIVWAVAAAGISIAVYKVAEHFIPGLTESITHNLQKWVDSIFKSVLPSLGGNDKDKAPAEKAPAK